MKGINRIIDALVSNGRSNKVSIDSDSLLESLTKSDYKPASKRWWEIHYQKGLRLILVLSVIIMMISVFLYYCFRYINDVILFENQIAINEQGAFTSRKSLNCEYANYYFTTTDLWANSGIQVNEKDRIRINISGGFNTRISDVIDAAENNTEPLFHWVSYDTVYKDQDNSPGIKNCISKGDKDYRFGSVMYAIAPESWDLQENPLQLRNDKQKNGFNLIFQRDSIVSGSRFLWKINDKYDKKIIDKKDTIVILNNYHKYRWFRLRHPDSRDIHPAGRTGTLFFAVNDMYFDNNDSIKEFFTDPVSIAFYGQSLCENAIPSHIGNPKVNYMDNLGQVLVSVEIQRYVPYKFFYPTMAYRFLEYHINETLDSIIISHDKYGSLRIINWLIKQLICIFWFGVFCAWVTLLFGLYMIVLLATIYILFITGRWVSSKLDKTYLKIMSFLSKNDA